VSVFDYKPVYGGAYYDPDAAGGKVSRLDLYGIPERTGTPTAHAGPAVRLRPGTYRFAVPDLPPGRYWATITFTPSEGAQPVKDASRYLDLPLGAGLVTSPEAVADELAIPLPLTPQQRHALENAILKAQADVVAYLKCPLIPQSLTLRAVTPHWPDNLDDPASWPLPDQDDRVTVAAYRPLGDGTYDVDLLVGLDGAAEEAIVRYVTAHAAESERQRPGGVGSSGRRISSVSAEGQSISYDSTPTTGTAGAPPALASLAGLRRVLYQPLNRPPRPPWPYGASTRYWRR
jgi:hypothetical protein